MRLAAPFVGVWLIVLTATACASGSDSGGPGDLGEPGTIGAPCATNGDCQSNLCSSKGVCSKACRAHADCGCPAGTTNADIGAGKCGLSCASDASCVKVCSSNGSCAGSTQCIFNDVFSSCK